MPPLRVHSRCAVYLSQTVYLAHGQAESEPYAKYSPDTADIACPDPATPDYHSDSPVPHCKEPLGTPMRQIWKSFRALYFASLMMLIGSGLLSTYLALRLAADNVDSLWVGALMAASAFESLLWKRRIRLIGYAFVLAGLLFSGNPGDYCTLAAALVGQAAGAIMARRNGHTQEHEQWWHGTDYEVRRLIAAIQLIFAFSPILALVSSSHDGPLSTFGFFLSGLVGDEELADVCADNLRANSCRIVFEDNGAAIAIDLITPEVPFRVAISIKLFELALAQAGNQLVRKTQA